MSRKQRIEELLKKEYTPIYLQVEDESHRHHVPQNAETHFKVIMATTLFSDLSRIARHRLINELLKKEFNDGLHALSMYLYTPIEWETQKDQLLSSPSCKDGYQK